MPGRARKDVFDPEVPGIYHCYTRCVRQAYLLEAEVKGAEVKVTPFQDGEWVEVQGPGRCKYRIFRRQNWVAARVALLAALMSVDVITYKVMGNHLHLVVRNRPDLAKKLTDREIARRWKSLNTQKLELREVSEEDIDTYVQDVEKIEAWRKKLSSISWFMRMLAEPIARAANAADGKKGHFWESRFKCQRLLDEAALLACLVYIELNAVRAGIARTPEESEYAAIADRIRDLMEKVRLATASAIPVESTTGPTVPEQSALAQAEPAATSDETSSSVAEHDSTPSAIAAAVPAAVATATVAGFTAPHTGWLNPIDERGDGYAGVAAGRRASDFGPLPISIVTYLEVVDWTGRQLRADKRGAIPAELAPIMERLGLRTDSWLDTVNNFGDWFGYMVGKPENVAKQAARAGIRAWGGMKRCRQAFS